MFTFLLFLSGYVMQQQTVRSLQEALHAPPTPKPTPTLPFQFQKHVAEDIVPVLAVGGVTPGNEDAEVVLVDAATAPVTVLVAGEAVEAVPLDSTLKYPGAESVTLPNEAGSGSKNSPLPISEEGVATVSLLEPLAELIPAELFVSSSASPLGPQEPALPAPLRLAYVFTVSTPPQTCSAILFFKQHSQSYQQTHTTARPTYLLLYPSQWETDQSNPAFTSALTLMREAQDTLEDIIYHPVRTTNAWSGLASASTHSQLLGELQRWHWEFDRMLYLRTPGLALDLRTLDTALTTSAMNLRRNWISTASQESGADNDPPVMLLSSDRRIRVPRGELRGRLTARAHAVQERVKAAAYVYFDDEEAEQRRDDSIFARYERERMVVCKDINFEEEKKELKRNET